MKHNGFVYEAARCTARFGRTKFAEQMLAAAKLRANRKHRSAGCYIFQIPKLVYFMGSCRSDESSAALYTLLAAGFIFLSII